MAPPFLYFGTPDFAADILKGLLEKGLRPLAVISAPDKPVGRGLTMTPSAVSRVAMDAGLALWRPGTVGTQAFRDQVAASGAVVGVVAAYGKIFGPKLLASLPLGFVNVHTSLLPRWRGAGPAQWAILSGDRETGVSFMRMEPGLDTGAVYRQVRDAIRPDDTPPVLLGRLGELAVTNLPDVLEDLAAGRVQAVAQDDGQATYARKLVKEDGRLDPAQPAVVLERMFRGLQPWPGAVLPMAGQEVALESLELPSAQAMPPGTFLKPGEVALQKNGAVLYGAGEGCLWIGKIKPPGKKAMAPADWLRGLRG